MWLLKSNGYGFGDSNGYGYGYGNRYGTRSGLGFGSGNGYGDVYGDGYGKSACGNYTNGNGYGYGNNGSIGTGNGSSPEGPKPDHLLLLAALQGGHHDLTK
jgi:hypothetical protein